MPHEPTAALRREVREVVAEPVASAVGSRVGLDLALRSTTYVASWLDDPEALRADMGAIHGDTASLIDAVEDALDQLDAPDIPVPGPPRPHKWRCSPATEPICGTCAGITSRLRLIF